MKCSQVVIAGLLFFLSGFLLICASTVFADDIHVYPGDSLSDAVARLSAGDTLNIHEGTYREPGVITITTKGTRSEPVVIQAAPGERRPLLTRSVSDSVQNTINIEGAEFVTISGLEISGNGGDGINMKENPAYLTLENLVIHDIAVGVNFRSDMHHIVVRDNHIYNTSDTGEGMYVGCNYATCIVSESLIEGNWIHDTLDSEQGDGIEIKRGSHSNVIRNNVIHDTNYPCILLYGTEGKPRNVVEGNAMWNCGDSGIQAAADAIIRNNLILDEQHTAFNSQPHQGVTPANLEFVHNTVIGGNPCLILQGWDSQAGLIFANNAVYCDADDYSVDRLGGVSFSGNVIAPATSSLPRAGQVAGQSKLLDFVDVSNRNVKLAERSSLLGAGDPAFTTKIDFAGYKRSGDVDVGAYSRSGTVNQSWMVRPGFKGRGRQ